MKRVFSGVQPSGQLTLGNYLGAMRHFVALQDEYECFYSVVDLHALTVPQDPEALRQQAISLAALYLATGIDPQKSTLFIQSQVPAHAELAWLLQCVSYMGELNRMTQYKEKAEQQESVTVGLFTYPALMAADILLYQADVVPVGEDQKQHVELTRDIAVRFNNRFGEIFTVPEPLIPKVGARIMSLAEPQKKMSKSLDSVGNIYLLDEPNVIKKKINRAVTDSEAEVRYDPANKPGVSNLMVIHALCAGQSVAAIEEQYQGQGYGALKKGTFEAVLSVLEPIQARYRQLIESDEIYDILAAGAVKAREVAAPTLERVKQAMGLNL
ncbi:MAG: tryptophan--tRNA ligase [Firmicutes bacterium]|nr:tryptophan--tRNA ligase [Bacillota bacterium]